MICDLCMPGIMHIHINLSFSYEPLSSHLSLFLTLSLYIYICTTHINIYMDGCVEQVFLISVKKTDVLSGSRAIQVYRLLPLRPTSKTRVTGD